MKQTNSELSENVFFSIRTLFKQWFWCSKRRRNKLSTSVALLLFLQFISVMWLCVSDAIDGHWSVVFLLCLTIPFLGIDLQYFANPAAVPSRPCRCTSDLRPASSSVSNDQAQSHLLLTRGRVLKCDGQPRQQQCRLAAGRPGPAGTGWLVRSQWE